MFYILSSSVSKFLFDICNVLLALVDFSLTVKRFQLWRSDKFSRIIIIIIYFAQYLTHMQLQRRQLRRAGQ